MDPIVNFKGTFSRGSEDTTPEDHFLDSQNIEFPFGGVDTRKGMDLDLTLANIRRSVLYKRPNESPRRLILTDGGNLYDSTSLSAPLITIAEMTDFSAAFFYGRAYISPHDGTKGLLNETIKVYDGTTLRVAGGAAPAGTMIAALSGLSGKIEPGTHLFGVVFETASGHLTKPGPVIFPSVLVETGNNRIDISGIPTGPAGTARRRIIATRSIQNYDGNQFGQEYFLVPNGIIEGNVNTTIQVSFYDSELQDTADYLFDIRETIPAGLVISSYKGKMVVGNPNEDRNLIFVSKTNEPETFDSADDIIIVDPTEAGGVTGANEHHGILLINKSFRSYTTSDNGAEPSTWEVLPFEKSTGTEVHGIGTILDANGVNIDRMLIASRVGLVVYNGTFQEPELTFKIDNIWKRINQNAFNMVEVAVNPIDKEIFIAVPLDDADMPSHLIYGNYADGLSFENLKWTLWTFFFDPTTIVVDLVNNTPMLKIGSHDGNFYKKSITSLNDDNHAIDSYIETALIPNSRDGIIRHYNWFRTRITGSGDVEVSAHGRKNGNPQTYIPFALISDEDKDVTRKLNFTGERCSVKLRLNEIDEWFKITSFMLNDSARWNFWPQ